MPQWQSHRAESSCHNGNGAVQASHHPLHTIDCLTGYMDHRKSHKTESTSFAASNLYTMYYRKPPHKYTAPISEPETLLSLWRRSWMPLTGAALAAGFLGFYIVGTVAASLRQPCQKPSTPCRTADPTGRPSALTGENVEAFDRELDWPEWWMGITRLRRRISALAAGDVLEVAVGTGRNLDFYQWKPAPPAQKNAPRGITSFTGLDISADMLLLAQKRLDLVDAHAAQSKGPTRPSSARNRLRLITADVQEPLPPPPITRIPIPDSTKPYAKYDTIIQTFGLCSVTDPVKVLENLAAAVKPGSGRIILLEHGRGWLGIVNGLLDRFAPDHYLKYGCWWNRDIESFIHEAIRSTPQLELVKLHRPNIWQLGTIVWAELRVTPPSEKP
ncbi:hypothetical protein CDD82_6665 [Ophiocordyceps australis]|uniref:Methyltransferase type 11 domain-containing protein n=1 Tax=Ophiocordyceps australis TaxID=1399860 RepID=A0A2C5YNZ8_9HYPO|nr:hypothetical protein CDD82_6665 [Ophiocordyceps australis]